MVYLVFVARKRRGARKKRKLRIDKVEAELNRIVVDCVRALRGLDPLYDKSTRTTMPMPRGWDSGWLGPGCYRHGSASS